MLPLTVLNTDIESNRESSCPKNRLLNGIPIQRQYEDKFALGNMVGNINLLLCPYFRTRNIQFKKHIDSIKSYYLSFNFQVMSAMFFVLRLPTLIVGIHKVLAFSSVRECLLQEQVAYPLWTQVVGILGEIFVIISLSTRSLGYIFLNENYYRYCKKILFCKGT